MELNLSSEDAAFRDEVRAFIAENYPRGNARSQSGDRPDQGADAAVASHPAQEGLDRAALAEGIWRAGLVDHPAFHLRTGDDARRHDAASGVQRHHGRPRHLYVRQ